ncbi:hypothetical protein BHE74_00058107, partial [Ensete ventricosum]
FKFRGFTAAFKFCCLSRSVWCVHRWSALWDDGGVVQDAIVPPCYFLIRSRYLPFAALFSGRTLSSVARLLTALLRSASQEDLQVLEGIHIIKRLIFSEEWYRYLVRCRKPGSVRRSDRATSSQTVRWTANPRDRCGHRTNRREDHGEAWMDEVDRDGRTTRVGDTAAVPSLPSSLSLSGAV